MSTPPSSSITHASPDVFGILTRSRQCERRDVRHKTIRISRLNFLLPVLLCFFTVFDHAQTIRAENSSPMQLTLSQAIDLALKQNRDLKLAQLAVIDKEHKKEIARSDYFPHIKNESSVLHVTELAGVEIPAGTFGVTPAIGPIPGHTLLIDQGALTGYTSGTGLAQPLTQMFKSTNRIAPQPRISTRQRSR